MNWETVNPQWWVPRGYAAVRVDGPRHRQIAGAVRSWSLAERSDLYDAVEWAAAQPWCNGKVGLLASPISRSISGSPPICSRLH